MPNLLRVGLIQACLVPSKKNAKMPGVMAEEIVVLKDGEVLTRTKGMLGISQEELSETKEFFVLLPNDIFDREESSNIL